MDNNTFDFNLLSIEPNWKLVDDNYRLNSSKPTEQCQLCTKMRKTFYCKNCVRNGDFIHSTSHLSERFAEKRLAVARMQRKKAELISESEKYLNVSRLHEDKVEEVRMRKEKIAMLQSLVSETRKKLERRKKALEELKRFNQSGEENSSRNEECKKDVMNEMNKIISKQPILVNELDLLRPRLKNLIKRRIDELVQFIFPINEVQSAKSGSLTSDSQEDIKNELAEATRTAYVRGRWVYTDSWGETQHSIVAPTLPDSGDYSPYIHWVSANKDNAIAMTSSSGVDHNAAYNTSAALTYATQLVNLIAYYLDIRLPNVLSYSEFCTTYLSERKFMNNVSQLNANILMLCLTQNVDPHLLQPTHTIRNLLLLLDHSQSDMGRSGTTDIATSCISFLEEQLSQQVREVSSRPSVSEFEEDDREPAWPDSMSNDNDNDEYDSDHLPKDWEAVPLVSCQEVIPSSNIARKPNPAQTSSIATGLVTSAATSLASILRVWSTNK